MGPLVKPILASFVRMALAALVGWLAKQGFITEGAVTADQLEAAAGAIVIGLFTAGWAVYTKVIDRREKLQALVTTKPNATLEDVKAAVKAGDHPPANTPNDQPPVSPTSVTPGERG